MVSIGEDQYGYVRRNLKYAVDGLNPLTVGQEQIRDNSRYYFLAVHGQSFSGFRTFSDALDGERLFTWVKKCLRDAGRIGGIILDQKQSLTHAASLRVETPHTKHTRGLRVCLVANTKTSS